MELVGVRFLSTGAWGSIPLTRSRLFINQASRGIDFEFTQQ